MRQMFLKFYFVITFKLSTSEVISRLLAVQLNESIIQSNSTLEIIESLSPKSCYMTCLTRNDCCASSFNKVSGTCLLDRSGQWRTTAAATTISKFESGVEIPGLPRDCSEIPIGSCSGKYTIYPVGTNGVQVYCDMVTDGGNWTVFQRNENKGLVFFRNWASYRTGFGDASSEFWIDIETNMYVQVVNIESACTIDLTSHGNDNLHGLTSQKTYTLRIDFWNTNDEHKYSIYDTFSVGNLGSKYRLTLGVYSGNAGSNFSYHNNMLFSTYDNDNDGLRSYNCAAGEKMFGGFWYNACCQVNLNSNNTYYNADKINRCVMMIRKN